MPTAAISRDRIATAAVALALLLVVVTIAPFLTKAQAGPFGAIAGCAVIALSARLRAGRSRI